MTNVTGGQTVRNPWPMIGGCASSTCREGEDFIRPIYGKEGDVIVLTKPLGTQLAVNMFEWMRTAAKYNRVKDVITVDEIVAAYKMAMTSMSYLNLDAADVETPRARLHGRDGLRHAGSLEQPGAGAGGGGGSGD